MEMQDFLYFISRMTWYVYCVAVSGETSCKTMETSCAKNTFNYRHYWHSMKFVATCFRASILTWQDVAMALTVLYNIYENLDLCSCFVGWKWISNVLGKISSMSAWAIVCSLKELHDGMPIRINVGNWQYDFTCSPLMYFCSNAQTVKTTAINFKSWTK